MTIDKSALKALAQRVIDLELTEDQPIGDAWNEFEAAANPAAVLAMLDEIRSLECRLEVSEDTLGVIRGCLKGAEGDIDRLKALLDRPDEIVADPVADYEGLRKQFLALRTIFNSKARQCEHWRQQSGDDVRKAMVETAANVSAERETNEALTNALLAAEDDIESLQKDAGRYLWLLKNWFTMSSEYKDDVVFLTGRARWSDLPEDAVSDAIDAAISKESTR